MNMQNKEQKKITLRDIAQAANVSTATVSNALNNRPGVSEELRQRIFQTAHQLDYVRSNGISQPVIRLIILKRHGYVVTDTPFFAALVEGIEKQCRSQDYELLISHFSLNEKERPDLIRLINTDHAAGLIVLATEMLMEDLAVLSHARIPIVLLDSRFFSCPYDRVLINNEEAAFTATTYLIEQGHQQIGYLSSSVMINNFNDRAAGYRCALERANLPVDDGLKLALEPTLDGSYRDMLRILDRFSRLPTAFFADNDIIACGAMKALQEKGIQIPEKVSIVGIDDMSFCELTQPRLTTVRVFKQELGGIAVRRLMEKIEGDPIIQQIAVGTKLVIRDSVCKLQNR